MAIYKDVERGTYYVSCYYLTWDKNRKRKVKRGFRNLRDAKQWEIDFLSGTSTTPDMRFERLAKLFITDRKLRLRENTVNGYLNLLENQINPHFANIPINEIEVMHIRQWQNTILDKGYSQTYQRRINTLLTNIFNYAVKYYGLPKNPCNIAGSIGKWKSKGINFWTLEEFREFIRHVSREDTHTAFETLYWTGLRIGEFLALTPEDVDLEAKTIKVSKSLQRIRAQDVITAPKTQKSNRVIYIHDELAELLRRYITSNPQIRSSDRLFPYTVNLLYGEMKRVCEAAGIKKIKIHDLRHSHISMLIELNFTPLLIAERVGHENVSTTLNIYSHLYPNKQSQLVEKLNELCMGKAM